MADTTAGGPSGSAAPRLPAAVARKVAKLSPRREDIARPRLLAAFPLTSASPVQATPSRPGPGPRPDPIESLTRREAEVLQLLAARLSNEEIAASLGISSETVKQLTRTIYQKLRIGTRRAAVDRAQAIGLPPPGPSGPMHTLSISSRDG